MKKVVIALVSIFTLLILGLLFFSQPSQTADLPQIYYTEIFEQEETEYLVYFWRDDCPRCTEFEPYVVEAFNRYSLPLFVVDMQDDTNFSVWFEGGIHAEADDTELPG